MPIATPATAFITGAADSALPLLQLALSPTITVVPPATLTAPCVELILLPAASVHAVVVAGPTATSSPVRSPASAAPALTTLALTLTTLAPTHTALAPTAYAPAGTSAALAAPALAALVRSFAPMVLSPIGFRNPVGYGRRALLAGGARGSAVLYAGGYGGRTGAGGFSLCAEGRG